MTDEIIKRIEELERRVIGEPWQKGELHEYLDSCVEMKFRDIKKELNDFKETFEEFMDLTLNTTKISSDWQEDMSSTILSLKESLFGIKKDSGTIIKEGKLLKIQTFFGCEIKKLKEQIKFNKQYSTGSFLSLSKEIKKLKEMLFGSQKLAGTKITEKPCNKLNKSDCIDSKDFECTLDFSIVNAEGTCHLQLDCKKCGFWRKKEQSKDKGYCPICNVKLNLSAMSVTGDDPNETYYDCPNCLRRYTLSSLNDGFTITINTEEPLYGFIKKEQQSKINRIKKEFQNDLLKWVDNYNWSLTVDGVSYIVVPVQALKDHLKSLFN